MVYIEIGLQCARRVGCNVAGQTVASKRHIWNMFNRATALGTHQRLVSYVERFPLFENRCRTQAKGFSYGCAKSHVSSQEV